MGKATVPTITCSGGAGVATGSYTTTHQLSGFVAAIRLKLTNAAGTETVTVTAGDSPAVTLLAMSAAAIGAGVVVVPQVASVLPSDGTTAADYAYNYICDFVSVDVAGANNDTTLDCDIYTV